MSIPIDRITVFAAAALLLGLGGIAFAQERAPTAPRPNPALTNLVESFVSLCVEGRPNQEESVRRAGAAGWREVRGREPLPALPPGQRLAVMQRTDMIFLTMPPMRGSPTSLGCEVGANFRRVMPLEAFASALATRLSLGPPRLEPFGSTQAAFWRPAPGFTLIAILPSGHGPKTHVLLARQELGADQ